MTDERRQTIATASPGSADAVLGLLSSVLCLLSSVLPFSNALAGESPPAGPTLTVVLRYDDWCAAASLPPHEAEVDLRVLEAAAKHRVPLTLAVIPAARGAGEGRSAERFAVLSQGDAMLEALVAASRNGPIEVALHGLHHTSNAASVRAKGLPSELAGLSPEEQAKLLSSGVEILMGAGLPRPAIMVPPWNTYDAATCRACEGLEIRLLSADLDGPPAPPASRVRLLPETADLGWVKRRGRALSLAASLKDPGAIAVVMMHSFDFQECRSDTWPVYARLAELDPLLAELRADPRIRLATFSEVAAEQGDALSNQRYEAAQTFAHRMRILYGVRLLPYRLLPDPALLSVYWSLPTYESLNRRALLLLAASWGVLATGAGLVSVVLLLAWRRRGRRSKANAECRMGAIGNRQSAIRNSLFVLGLAALAAALLCEALWLVRQPTGAQMGFAVNRLGLKVTLSRAQSDAFGFGSAAVAALVAAAAGLALSRSLTGPTSPTGPTRPTRPIRAVLGLALVLFLATPLHYAVAWADGGLYGGTAAAGSEWGRREFLRDFGLQTSAHLFWLAALACLGGHLLLTRRRWPAGLASRVVEACARLPRWLAVLGASAVVVALASAFSLGVQGGIAHFSDATAYYFQGKTFAAGRLSSPLLGDSDFFNPGTCLYPGGVPYAFVGDRWFSVGLPFPALCYAVGFLLGVPWVIAPLLGGAIVVAAYYLAREVFGPSAALLVLPLAAVSPWLILMSGEYLTHVPGAAAGLVFLLMAFRAMRLGNVECRMWKEESASARRATSAIRNPQSTIRNGLPAALAGLSLGLAANARPVTAIGLCLPVAVAWGIWLIRRPAAAWRPSLAFAVGLAVPLAGLLAYNAATTGHATTFAYQVGARHNSIVWERQRVAAGGAAPWRWSPPLGLANFAESLHGLERATFRWPIPWLGAALAVLLLLGLGREARGRGPALLLVLTIPSLALAYVHWARAPEALSGPRYVFEVLPVAIILLAGAVRALYERLTDRGVARERVRAVLLGAFVFCAACGLAGTLTRTLPDVRDYARSNLRMLDRVSAGAERPAIVFLDVPFGDRFTMKLHLAVSQNDPALAGPLLYARDLGERDALLLAARPGRHAYRWDPERERLEPLAATRP